MDQMTIHTEPAETGIVAEATAQAGADELAKKIKASIGITAKVLAGKVGAVPRSQGKAVRLIDSRPEG